MNPVIRADGNPKFAMASTLAGAVINIILDPIFIFCFKWGMMGAAVATVIGQVVTAILAVWYIVHMKTVKPSTQRFCFATEHLRKNVVARNYKFFVSNQSCCGNGCNQQYASQIRCARPYFQAGTVCANPNGGSWNCYEILPDCHFNSSRYGGRLYTYYRIQYGCREKVRVKELFTKLLVAEALVGAVALVLAEGFPHQLIAIFGAKNESVYYTEFAIKAFRIYLCMMILACVNKACFIFLQAVGKALSSTMLSMFREVVFGVGFALLLPVFFGLDGVLYSMPVSDILTFIISAIIIVKTYKELNTKGAQSI